MMKKANLMIVVIFVGLLFLSGCTQTENVTPTTVDSEINLSSQNNQQQSREPQTSGAVGLEYKSCDPEDFTKLDAYYFPIFAKDDSPEYCRPREDRPCHSDMCYTKYFRYVVWRKNPQLCEKLNQSIEEFWKNKCFYEVSFFQFDRNICNKLSNDQYKAFCLMQAENTTITPIADDESGVILGNVKYKINGLGELDRALYYAKKWFKVCSYDPTLSYEHDLERPSPPTKKEVAECEIRILDYLKNNYEKGCNDKFCDYFRAFDKDNISSCEIVEDYKNSCLNTFYGFHGESITAEDCEKLSSEAKDDCLSEVAVESDDVDLCEKLSEKDREDCLIKLSIKNNDLDLCLSLGEYDSSDCIKQIAVNLKDVNICFKIDNYNLQAFCVENYAYELTDLTVCSDERYRGDTNYCEDKVFEKLALYEEDVAYCYKIHDQKNVDWCVSMHEKRQLGL